MSMRFGGGYCYPDYLFSYFCFLFIHFFFLLFLRCSLFFFRWFNCPECGVRQKYMRAQCVFWKLTNELCSTHSFTNVCSIVLEGKWPSVISQIPIEEDFPLEEPMRPWIIFLFFFWSVCWSIFLCYFSSVASFIAVNETIFHIRSRKSYR